MIRSKLFLVFLALSAGLSISVPAHAQSAGGWFERGQKAEIKDDYQAAYEAYAKAYHKNPGDLRYKASYLRLKVSASAACVTAGEKLRKQGDDGGALTQFMRALEIDPSNELAQQDIDAIRKHQASVAPVGESPNASADSVLESVAAPAELKPLSSEPLTLHMVEDVKNIYQAIGKAAGINVLFDPEYVSKRIQIDVTNETLSDTLRILGTVSGTFYRAITPDTIFVAQNTRAKRTDLEEQAVQTFYLTNASQQNDLNDIQTALRNVIQNAKMYGVPSQNAIVMRATPDELLLAQKLINDLDKSRSEVVVDVAVMEISRDKLRNIGLTLPQTVGVTLQSSTSSSSSSSSSSTTDTTSSTTSSTNLTLNSLANLNANNFAVTVSSATANLLLSDSDTHLLQNPRIRATDGQKATMKVGSRIPVATGSYQTGTAATAVSSLVNTQFQYIDVGVNIEMTPTVHYDRDVTLKMKIEVSSQSGSETISGVTEPIISQRTVEQVIRLKEGEASILGGILEKQESKTVSGTPGLGEIPILKYLFSSNQHEVVDDEIVFVLIPHVVRATQINPLNLRTLDSGTGQTVEMRRVAKVVDDSDQADSAPAQSGLPTAAESNRALNPPAAAVAPAAVTPAPVTPRPAPPAIPTASAPVPAQAPVSAAAVQTIQAKTPATPAALTPAAAASPVAATTAASTAAVPAAPAKTAEQIQAELKAAQTAQPKQPAAPPGIVVRQPGAAPAAPLSFVMVPEQSSQALNSTFQIAVNLAAGKDVYSVPLQVQYDKSLLALVNVDSGNLLGKDGQAVSVVHRDDGNGGLSVVAARPPGSAGVDGSGTVCVLTFQAKAAGDALLKITRVTAMNSGNQQIPTAAGAQALVHIK